jgi:hypothetical protein
MLALEEQIKVLTMQNSGYREREEQMQREIGELKTRVECALRLLGMYQLLSLSGTRKSWVAERLSLRIKQSLAGGGKRIQLDLVVVVITVLAAHFAVLLVRFIVSASIPVVLFGVDVS